MGLNLKISYQIVSLFDMYIDMGERIAGKQDRPSLIIEDPLRNPLNSPKYTFFFTFWLMYEKLVFKLFPLVISRGAEGPGREILQTPPVRPSVCPSVCPSRLVFAL